MIRGISLANKCLILFGFAIMLIVTLALAVPWIRMNAIVAESQLSLSKELVAVWAERNDQPVESGRGSDAVPARKLSVAEWRAEAERDPFLRRALGRFQSADPPAELQRGSWQRATRRYQYAQPVFSAAPPQADALAGVIVLDRISVDAARLLALNAVYHLAAGVAVFGLAVLVFYFITSRLILEPVRGLRVTAERVGEGELTARADIATGDEFQQLGEAFNTMLEHVQASQQQLRSINTALDLKVGELATANVALYDSARLKGEFVASVSHELRTPLNSIIGFAELLLEIAQAEAAAGDDSTRQRKRARYLDNILNSSRHLLEMIDSLLEMARIEAGRVEVRPERVETRELCESLVGLMEPIARRKDIALVAEIAADTPPVETDRTKLQQILFNLLSNAVKFSGRSGVEAAPTVTLRAERLPPVSAESRPRVRLSVIDTGPGIAPDDQARIFDKFQQADAGLTRAHEGTGLGLAISKELAALIQGEIQLISELGSGAMFSLIIPETLDHDVLSETRVEQGFRGKLTPRPAS
ncbi:MAG: HAMP domain-containing sensor histidine kinase [Planctomycetota bacterium]